MKKAKYILENQKVLSMATYRPPGDEALFNMGLIYAHSGNPKKDFEKSIADSKVPILVDFLKGPAAQAPTAILNRTIVSSPTETIVPVISPSIPSSAPTSTNSIPHCPGPLPSRLRVGMNAEVTTSGMATQLRLRAEPSFNASTNHIIAAGRNMVILDGTVCAEGYYWWYIRSEQGFEGWASEGDFEDYWIDPLP